MKDDAGNESKLPISHENTMEEDEGNANDIHSSSGPRGSVC